VTKHKGYKKIKEATLKRDYLACLEYWKKRWHECILSGRDYFNDVVIDLEEQIKIFYFKNKFTLLFAHSTIYIIGSETEYI